MAYIAGFYIGDGKGAGHEPKVRFELADQEQLQLVSRLVAQILRRKPKQCTRDGPFYVVDYDSVVLSEYLNRPVEWLVDQLKDFVGDFVQGFFDAEGYASCQINLRTKQISSVVVGAANTRLEYLNLIERILMNLGIHSAVRKTNKKGGNMTIRGRTWIRRQDVYQIVVHGFAAVDSFHKLVGFRNRTKAEKLRDLVNLRAIAPTERYAWFVAHYRKVKRRWIRI